MLVFVIISFENKFSVKKNKGEFYVLKNKVLIAGGGLTGLSAGYVLSKAGLRVSVFENDTTVGGLSKTIEKNGFRFDLGGHRFFTRDKRIDGFVKELMDGELITVHRKSKIYLRKKYFDYPLKPLNAIFGLGIPTTMKIISDYSIEMLRKITKENPDVSLEDWVVGNFGRTMFNIYFKEYSEKVWGLECSRISADWVAQRIKGLSLSSAIRNAFFKFSGRDLPTLTDTFMYPELGIGRISERLKQEIEKRDDVFTETKVEAVNHSDFRVNSLVVRNHKGARTVSGNEFISSLPMNKLIMLLNPSPPENIVKTALALNFRDLIVVAIMVEREKITDQTWIYIPEQRIPFGRIHEPTNWSRKMAPAGKTLIVTEFFSFIGDRIWNMADENLIDITVKNLEKLGFIKKPEVIDGVVVRAPKAYPLFEVGYKKICDEIYDYLCKFKNLHIAGRSGLFRYYNMDHAIESGIDTAEKIIKRKHDSEVSIALEENSSNGLEMTSSDKEVSCSCDVR